MPTTSDALRQKFMTPADRDGICTCENMVYVAGGTINQGMIMYSGDDAAVLEAIQFLCEEWDYATLAIFKHPLFTIKKIGSETYIAVRKTDTEKSQFHIISDRGVNFGAWESIENFVEARKRAISMPSNERTSDKLIATPLGLSSLSVRALQ